MAWGGIIADFGTAVSVDELPRNFAPEPLGLKHEIVAILESTFPDGDHSPEATQVIGEGYSLELRHGIHVNDHGGVEAISVRINGEPAVFARLRQLCEQLGARLFDNQSGDLVDFSDSAISSLERFNQFRDRARNRFVDDG